MATSGSEDSICGERASLEDEEVHLEELDWTESSTPNSKRVRQSENAEGLLSRGTNLDHGSWNALDEPLREKTIAMLPFKSLFQAALLSKAWKLKFCCGSFQSEVQSSAAASWSASAPLYVNRSKDLVENWCLRAGIGSLLCWTSEAPFKVRDPYFSYTVYCRAYHVHVTNPLTRCWRQLPDPPLMLLPEFVHVGCEGTEAYEVTLVTRCPGIWVQIFDSITGSWTIDGSHDMGSIWDISFDCYGSALLHGLFITMVFNRWGYELTSLDMTDGIWKDMTDGIWKDIPHLCRVMDGDNNSHERSAFGDAVLFSQVLVCGSNVMQVVAYWNYSSDEEHTLIRYISVFKVDLEHGLAVEVARAPNDMGAMESVGSAAAHGDCIYIGGPSPSCPSIVYNVMTQEWQWLKSPTDKLKPSFSNTPTKEWLWTPSITYQPGLNPFVKV